MLTVSIDNEKMRIAAEVKVLRDQLDKAKLDTNRLTEEVFKKQGQLELLERFNNLGKAAGGNGEKGSLALSQHAGES